MTWNINSKHTKVESDGNHERKEGQSWRRDLGDLMYKLTEVLGRDKGTGGGESTVNRG